MDFDPLYNPYPSERMTTFARRGMVATAQPLAAEAGLEILKRGGNAVDAAIATAACLTVVEPNSNSIGGDTFAIVWFDGKMFGLNGSGSSPKSISIDVVKAAGYEKIPQYGLIPVTVPGTPAAWAALSRRFGKLPLTEVLEPAIRYAEEGYPVSPTIGKYWAKGYEAIRALHHPAFEPWLATFAPNGRPPKIGEMWSSPDHAASLRAIAKTNANVFYQGELADKIEQFVSQHNGYLTKADLADYEPEWVEPISVHYKGYDVWEIPPNGQGIIALMALNMLKDIDMNVGSKDSVDTYHQQIEAVKLAFSDGYRYITDPLHMHVSPEDLLSESYAQRRRRLIGETACIPEAGHPFPGDTVYLATADGEGNMVSLIQSHAGDFGSGVVIPGTGICLQNRGTGFSLNETDANALQPGKKTFHTIIPGFLTKAGQPVGPFGVMCGMIQPQAHVQIVMNLVDFLLNPQAALDAPRWRWIEDRVIEVEPRFPDHIAQALARKGHVVLRALDAGMFGRGQIILRDPETGVLAGGTESRADGDIAAW